jgi:hypothetical protein
MLHCNSKLFFIVYTHPFYHSLSHTHIHTHTLTPTHTHTYSHTHIHTCTHTHTPSHAHTHTHTPLFSLFFYVQSAMSSSKRELLGAPLAEDAGNVTVRIKCFPTNMVYRPGTYCMCTLYVRTFFCYFGLFLISCTINLFSIHLFLVLSYLSILFFFARLSCCIISYLPLSYHFLFPSSTYLILYSSFTVTDLPLLFLR